MKIHYLGRNILGVATWSVQGYLHIVRVVLLTTRLYTQYVLLGFLLVAKEYLVSFIEYLICTTIFLSRDVIHDVT